MSRPRVALLSCSAGIQAGGAEAYTFAVAQGLHEGGVPVTLIHGRGPACDCASIGIPHITGPLVGRDNWLSGILRKSWVYRATRTSPYDLEVFTRWLLASHGWTLLQDFDLIEVQYAVEAGFFRYARPGAMKILHLHGPSIPAWLPGACRKAGTEPDLVITCSEWSRRELLARNVPWPIEVNYNGVDPQMFRPAHLPADRQPDVRPFRIGFVSRLVPGKGLQTLAEVAQRLGAGFEIHAVGPKEGIHSLPDTPNLIYRGAMGPQEVAEFLRSMDCFYFPSQRDAFPIAVEEAMASGLPIVASEIGGIPEMIRHGVNGILVAVGDAQSATSWIQQLRENTGMRKALGDEARHTVLDRFTLTHTTQRLLDLHDRWKDQRLKIPQLETVELAS